MDSRASLQPTLHRGREDEDEDYEGVVQKLLGQDFDAWPNEAGFEGLTEVRGPVELRVKGHIPPWAAGALYRTGPGQYNIEDTPRGTWRATHWFDGFAHSHKFEIVAEKSEPTGRVRVRYTSKRQAQKLVEAIRKQGRQPNISFGQRQDPCVGLFGKIMSVWRGPSPDLGPEYSNVAVAVHIDAPGMSTSRRGASNSGHKSRPRNVWLSTDHTTMKEMDPDSLEPLGTATQKMLHPLLRGALSSAHAQRDPETGDMFNYNLDFGYTSTYRIFRVNASTGTTDILATIKQPDVRPAYIHSLFLTKSYVVLCVPSTHIGGMGLKIPWGQNIVDAIEPFTESKLCKWFIVDRVGNKGVAATFNTPAGFFFHSINSFEEVNESTGEVNIFCDLIEYATTDVIRAFEMGVLLRSEGMAKNFWGDEKRNRDAQARFARYRFRVPRNPGAASLSTLEEQSGTPDAQKVLEIKAPHVGELPTINPLYATKKYRYVYSLANRGYSTLLDSIVKTDLETRQSLYWDNAPGHTPGEAIYVPHPGATEEDDGVLLSVVLDGHSKTSYLICLNAKTLEELGKAECDWAVGFGFHGAHVTNSL